jgi:hypothetical protein
MGISLKSGVRMGRIQNSVKFRLRGASQPVSTACLGGLSIGTGSSNRTFVPQPYREICRVKTHRAGNPEGWDLTACGHFVHLLNGNPEDRCDVPHAQGLGLVLDELNQSHGKSQPFPEAQLPEVPSMMG